MGATETEVEDLRRRVETLTMLIELSEGDTAGSCWGPDRAERLLRRQSSASELRELGLGEQRIEAIFGKSEEEPKRTVRPERRGGSFAVRVEARFESAHFLRSYRGTTEPLHGHSYRVEVELRKSDRGLDGDELAVDFIAARDAVRELAGRLDYGCINEIAPFTELNPTAENVAKWFADELATRADALGGEVVEVRLWEGPENSVVYRPAG
ncbi:MAG: 6-carboxytetrahydropterin synthase [Acidobacteria bacterium]|nr:6-carboxytetrahydropterin synthase [Acidobacteriota bacterium]